MKIYFAASIRGADPNKAIYKQLIEHLSKHGKVLTEHIGGTQDYTLSQKEIFKQDMIWLSQADLFIAEVTSPSLGVGFEIRTAYDRGIPILCLYQGRLENLSALVAGCPNIQVKTYKTVEQARQIIDNFNAIQDA